MSQRIDFRFGKNSSFSCEIDQIILPEGTTDVMLHIHAMPTWVWIRTSDGGRRMINTSRCTQIVIGMPDTPASSIPTGEEPNA